METIRTLVELLLAINIFVLTINYSILSKQVKNMSNNIFHLMTKDVENIEEIRR